MRRGFKHAPMGRGCRARDDLDMGGPGHRHGGGPGMGHGPGRGFGPGGPEGRGGHRRRRGMMDAEELRLLLLSLLADQPRHGYDLIRGIEDLTGGAYAPSPGVVYPALSLLADMSLVEEAESEGTRKVFVITQAGTADLTEKAVQVDSVLARLKALANDEARVDVTPVRRAMENLRTVLKTRLIREDADKDMVHDIAARLDTLAQDVERL